MPPTDADKQPITDAEVVAATPEGWNVGADHLVARYLTGDFNTGARFVQRIAELADEANHHPDVDLRYPHVTLALKSHDVLALTRRDVALAVSIHAAAAELGIDVGPTPDRLEIALDTSDHARVQPFYAALLGYEQPGDFDGNLVDPAAVTVPVWFQPSDSTAPDRQRWHLDVIVSPEVAQERIAAAVAAGGTLVDDSAAPAFWVLADADGNRSCICTWEGRD